MPRTERLVNPTTGEIWDDVDVGQLQEHKMPEGFKLAADVTLKEWIALVRRLRTAASKLMSFPQRENYGASSDSDFDAD